MVIKIDGGLSTALEERGSIMQTSLWTGELLRSNPDAIRQAHVDYLRAGAEIIITSSYQISFQGGASFGWSESEVSAALKLSTLLAAEAISINAAPAKVAASVGPYGAALADGSEYRGNYDASTSQLREFHSRRLEVLAASKPDLFAVETIPEIREAEIIVEVLNQFDIPYWISFSCVNERNICAGTSFEQAVRAISGAANLLAVGINCTSPDLVTPLLASAPTNLPFVVYPNSGRKWDALSKTWSGGSHSLDPESVKAWVQHGAMYVGGCCGVGPADIATLQLS